MRVTFQSAVSAQDCGDGSTAVNATPRRAPRGRLVLDHCCHRNGIAERKNQFHIVQMPGFNVLRSPLHESKVIGFFRVISPPVRASKVSPALLMSQKSSHFMCSMSGEGSLIRPPVWPKLIGLRYRIVASMIIESVTPRTPGRWRVTSSTIVRWCR